MNKREMITAAAAAIAAGTLAMTLAGCGHPAPKPGAEAAQRARSAAQTHVGQAASAGSARPAAAPATPKPAPAPVPPAAQPAAQAPLASVDSGIKVYANCTSPSFEPTDIIVTCADAGWVLEHLVWASWTSTTAIATGTLVYKVCTPSCAEGHFQQVPATRVLLSDPRPAAGGQLVWTRLQEIPWIPGYVTGPLHGAPYPLPTSPV